MRTRKKQRTTRSASPTSSGLASDSMSYEFCDDIVDSGSDAQVPECSDYNLRERHEADEIVQTSHEDSLQMIVDDSDSESDSHEDTCKVCGDDDDPGKLLCCDTCPNVYHLKCLDPPLKKVPKGKWSCPRCHRACKLLDLDRILAEKTGDESAYYVKWKNQSYRHCSWISKELFAAAKVMFPQLGTKQRSFESRDQDIELRAYDPTEFVNGIHKSWTIVEKILDTDADHESFLVKWKGLKYDECTWELAEEISDAQQEIQAFKKQTSIRADARRRRQARQEEDNTSSNSQPDNEMTRFTETPGFLNNDCQLHEYQLEGLTWLKFKWDQKENIILADEMGLGKTIQAIAFLASLWDEGVCLPHLIVAPLSTIQNWKREFETWAPQLKVAIVTGNKDERKMVVKHEIYLSKNLKKQRRDSDQKRIKCHVILTSYEGVHLEARHFRKITFACLIIDEGHRLKRRSSRLVRELSTFSCHHRTLLTGTPLQNNIQELFALLHFLDARKFDSWESFEAEYTNLSEKDQVKKLHGLLIPHLLRRLKKDVLKNLPSKKEQIVRVEMTEAQREMYKSILAKNFHLLMTDKKNDQARRGLLSVVTELRKCCAHPYLFDGVERMNLDKASELKEMIDICGKLSLLDRLLTKLKEKGHRVLIYSQFVIMLNILEDYLVLKEIGFLRIDGSLGGADRQKFIDAFNHEHDKYFVFLLSTRAGGLGINLATADTVILYDSDYNPHNDIQAQARCHRLGQKNPVLILRMVTRLSIEERMIQLAKEKLVLEQIVVRKMGNEELKQDELDGILRYGAAELFADERLADAHGQGLTVTERETERMRADVGQKRIVYDDEALEKLLDRSDMTTAEEDKMEVDNGDLMEGFKIANFDVTVKPESTVQSWEELLKHRKEVQEMILQRNTNPHILTPGRRRRRSEVVYRMDEVDSDNSDSEYDGEDQDNEETESSDLEDDLESGAESKNKPKVPKANENVTSTPVDQTPSIVEMPVVAWNEGQLLIHGFIARERQLFLNLMLRFGFPYGALEGADVEWIEFKSRLPRRKHPFIEAYAKTLLAAAKGDVPAGVRAEDLLFDTRPEDLHTRIGMMDLFRKKLHRMASHPFKLWTSSVVSMKIYSGHRCWGEAQDWALVRAVTRYGHGRWEDCLSNGENNMAAVLCEELGLEPLTEEAIDLSQSPERESADLPQVKVEKPIVQGKTEDGSAMKSKIGSMAAKCQNWMISRLKMLFEFMAEESTSKNQQNIQLTTHPVSASLVVPGSLRWKYQAILSHCFAVRECSNRVTGKQSYEQLQAAGVQFRTQMQELGQMAESLCQSLPKEFEMFKAMEADLRQRQLRPAPWTSTPQRTSTNARLDTSLGTTPSTSSSVNTPSKNPPNVNK